MKRIGLLGGMSWESTAEYYRLANELVRDRLGGLHSADLLMASLDFADIEQLQATGAWDVAGRQLAGHARRLQLAGADLLVLCTNTMHIVADAIAQSIDIPFLHLADTTADAIGRASLTRVGLLGTAFTMEQDFYRDRLAARGLDVLVPDADDRAEVHRVIYEELVVGRVLESSRDRYREVIGRLVAAGAEGIILGCTEIELLIGTEHSPVPVFPTTRLHVEAAVDAALAGEPTVRPNPTLDHVVIAVSDWRRSEAFYRDVLGARVVDHPDGRIAFRFGSVQLNAHGPGVDVGSLVAARPVAPGGSDLCFVWNGTADEARAHLERLGVELEAGPMTRHGGQGAGTSVYFRDPDGSLLEFISY